MSAAAQIAQIAQQSAAPVTQAVLTLSAAEQTAQPNQAIQFALHWDRPIYRYTYTYDWGDGSAAETTTNLTAQHAYAGPGEYAVRVSARSLAMTMFKAGVIESNAVNILVPAPQKSPLPEKFSALLTVNKPNAHVGDTVTFTATLRPETSDAQYTYDFGDGSAPRAASSQTSYSYKAAGVYPATVTILTHDGEQSTMSRAVEVRVARVLQSPAPLLKVTLENEQPIYAGSSVAVTAALKPAQKTASFEFDWGDGSPLERVTKGAASHTYSNPGSYEVVVAAETRQTYDPPLQGVVKFTIEAVPTAVRWWWIVGGAAILGFIGWMIWRGRLKPSPKPKPQPVPVPGPSADTDQLRRGRGQQAFGFVPHAGVSLNVCRMKPKPSSIGSITFKPALGSEEHAAKFKTRDLKSRTEAGK